ncbi:MAG: hypothetical protein ACAH95_00275 [Fimbriimonas sp.]
MFHQKISSHLSPRTLSLLALAVVSASAHGQVTKSGDGYLLRVKYVKGQTLKYSSVNSIIGAQGGGQPMKITMPMIMKITDVTKGYAKASITTGPAMLGKNPMSKAQTVFIELSPTNAAKSKGAPGIAGAQFPLKPVKVGQTWSMAAPIADTSGMTGGDIKAMYKFGGLKTVNGKSMAVVSYSLSGGVTGGGTLLLLAADGTLYSNVAKITLNASAGNMRLSSEMKRV